MGEPGSLETQAQGLSLSGSVTLGRTLKSVSSLQWTDAVYLMRAHVRENHQVISVLGRTRPLPCSTFIWLQRALTAQERESLTQASYCGPCGLEGHQTRCGYPSSGHSKLHGGTKMLGLHLSCNRVSFLLYSYSPPVLGVIQGPVGLQVPGGALVGHI